VSTVGNWSSKVNGHLEVLARNLTFEVSSNQVAAQLLVLTANNVPIPATGESQDRTFAATVRDTEAVGQITGSYSHNHDAMRVLNLLNSQPTIQAGRKLVPSQYLLNLSQHDAACRIARAIKNQRQYILFNGPKWPQIGENK
jgi:hypothetical protein